MRRPRPQEQGQPGGRGGPPSGVHRARRVHWTPVWDHGQRPGSRSSFGSRQCRGARERVRLGRDSRSRGGEGRGPGPRTVPPGTACPPPRPCLSAAGTSTVSTGLRCYWCLLMLNRSPEPKRLLPLCPSTPAQHLGHSGCSVNTCSLI